jgi:pimeloyl-ACP methyl ester carboxylesterase
LTPRLASLAEYRLEPRALDEIAEAVRTLSTLEAGTGDEEVGLIGFSFAGGLAVLAATNPELEPYLDYVANVGGHHDLARVMHFLVEDEVELPGGVAPMKAHEYGLVIAVYQNVERLVPEVDRTVMREALLRWLEEDREAAWSVASLRTTLEAERLFRLLVEERLRELRPELEPLLEEHEQSFRALSPRGSLARLDVPLYWLHGADDNVIPPSESDWARLERPRHTHVLVSPLIKHVEVAHQATLKDELELVHFMAQLI